MYFSLGPHPHTPMVHILTLQGPPHLTRMSMECKDVDHCSVRMRSWGIVQIMSSFAPALEIKTFQKTFYFIKIYTYLVNFWGKLVFKLEPPFNPWQWLKQIRYWPRFLYPFILGRMSFWSHLLKKCKRIQILSDNIFFPNFAVS